MLALLAFAMSASSARAVECRLGDDGSIAIWLLSPPFPLDTRAGFAKDLLPPKRGETSAVRRMERPGPVPKGWVKWRGEAFSAGHLDVSRRCLKRGESVFYAACELQARQAGTYLLNAAYWSQLAVWLDGKRVLEGAGDNDLLVPRKSVQVKLERGKPHHLLVKLGSSRQQAFLKLTLTTTDPEPKAAPVSCIVRIPPERVGELLAQSLMLSAPGGQIIQVNKIIPMNIGAAAGCPLVKGEVTVSALIVDHKGRLVREFKKAKISGKDLAIRGIPLPWIVPKESEVPRYTVRADVLYAAEGEAAGKKVGELKQSFYLAKGLNSWMRALRRRLETIDLQIGARRRYIEPDFALARLKLEKAQLFGRANEYGTTPWSSVVEELEACELAVARLEKHRKRPVRRGLTEHAYISTMDDQPQPYYIYVPRKHTGRTPLPCLVYLHGYSPDLNKLNWELIPRELLDYCEKFGYYLVAPFARSNTDFQGVGELDVIHVFQLLVRQYPIDPDRVFLFGYSMGAMGAFTVGAHFPDVWAGIVSISGRADYYLWKDLDRSKVEPYKRHLIDMEFGASMLGNYRNLPVLMYHGGADTLIKLEQSRQLHMKLKGLGADVTLHELPGEDHWIMSSVMLDDAVFKWMAKRKRNAWPAEVDFTTYTIKYRQSYWVTVLEMVRWGDPINVHAKFNRDKSMLEVKTKNVASLRLNLSKELIGEAPKLTVRINGKTYKVTKPGPVTYEVEPTKRVGKLRKTPRLCGPVKAAYNRRFLLVIDSGGDTEEDAKRFRQAVIDAASEWYQFTKSMPRVRRHSRVTDADVTQSNLILYGKPSHNAKLKEIAGKLPIKITGQGFELQGKKYSSQTHGLVMIYPNPQNPARYVVIRSGLPYGELLSANHKYDLLPDFVIFRNGTDYDDTDRAVVAGFFDENWQVAERLIWRRGTDAPDPRRVKPEPFEAPPLPEN